MGDFGLYDEYTQGLLDTFERLGLRKQDALYEALVNSLNNAVSNFGTPTQLHMSPAQHSAMLNIYSGGGSGGTYTFTEEQAKKHFAPDKVDWSTGNFLPAGLDPKDLKGIVSDAGLAKFLFLKTLDKLDLGGNPYSYSVNWIADAEL